MKPMLAEDWDEARQEFPVIAQPKIDGVRALNLLGQLTGRSLKAFKNRHVSSMFSHSALIGLDGEMAAQDERHPDLCRLTTSALGTIQGQPYVLWHLFDYVTADTRRLPYFKRLTALRERVQQIAAEAPQIYPYLRVIPSHECSHAAILEHFDSQWLSQGYEGTILRDPYGVHKSGRSTVREGGLLRIKRFKDAEGVVEAVHEGQTNLNEAKINELGNTERSTHQANMVANGMVGTLTLRLLAPVEIGDKVLPAGERIVVSAGRLTADERARYLRDPALIVGKVARFQYFPKGVKDKLRFPTFQSLRMAEDLS
jgi:DNA ligase 1